MKDVGSDDVQENHPTMIPTRITDDHLNWMALMLWGFVLLASVSTLLYGVALEHREHQRTAQFQQTLWDLELHAREISDQARRVAAGSDEAIERLVSLREAVERALVVLDVEASAGFDSPLMTEMQQLSDVWARLAPRIRQLSQLGEGRGVVRTVDTHMSEVFTQTPELLRRLEMFSAQLMAVQASVPVIELGNRLQLLGYRFLTGTHILVAGETDPGMVMTTLREDRQQLNRALTHLQTEAGPDVALVMDDLAAAFQPLVDKVTDVLVVIEDYIVIRQTARTIDSLSVSLLENLMELKQIVEEGTEQPTWLNGLPLEADLTWLHHLPWILSMSGLIGVVGMIWTLVAYVSRRKQADATRRQQSLQTFNSLQDWINRLEANDLSMEITTLSETPQKMVDSMNRAVEAIRQRVSYVQSASNQLAGVINRSEPLITECQTCHGVQIKGIQNAAEEIGRIRETLLRISQSASQSSDHVKVVDQHAGQGAELLESSVAAIGRLHSRVEHAQSRLKQLKQSARQMGEIGTLTQEITEQANLLTLNASIQSAKTGETGNGFAVIVTESRRLAERFNEASDTITGIVRAVQNETNEAIQGLESTAADVEEGTRLAEQLRQSQSEIRRIIRTWQEMLGSLEHLTSDGIDDTYKASTKLTHLDQSVEETSLTVNQLTLILGDIKAIRKLLEDSYV